MRNRSKGFTLVELLVVILIILILSMMVLPLPPFLLDLLFTFNIALSIMVLLVSMYTMKALDFAALLLLAAVAAAASGTALPSAGRGPVILAVALTLGALALLVAGANASGRLARHPGVQRTVNSLKLGLTAFTSPVTAACVCTLALLQWFINSLNYYWVALAFGLSSVTVTKSAILSFTGAAASSAPGMPGYFGSFELGISAVLTAWGINREAALAYAAARL